jgi:L-malate glycosyltransferase
MKHPAIHQIMPGFLYGDAVGNQAARIRDLLRGWGYHSQVYAQYRDRRLDDPGRDYIRCRPAPDDLVVFHYSIGSPVTEFVRRLPCRVIVYYHNITPAGFLRGYNEPLADLLDQGRRELAWFKDAALALAASEYDRQEMLALGFRHVQVLPYFVTFDALRASADSAAGRQVLARYEGPGSMDRDGCAVNPLFVGRLVPSKRQDDLLRAFSAYHHVINPHSRLLLVGSDSNAPGYRLELEAMATALGLSGSVVLPGAVGLREGLGGYYRAATLFLCLSEHEGFCIPLVEAMAFDVPVIAYRSTGVPYAMGGAGILVGAKRYDLIAELIDLLVRNQAVREQVLAGQRRRLEELSSGHVADILKGYIEQNVPASLAGMARLERHWHEEPNVALSESEKRPDQDPHRGTDSGFDHRHAGTARTESQPGATHSER